MDESFRVITILLLASVPFLFSFKASKAYSAMPAYVSGHPDFVDTYKYREMFKQKEFSKIEEQYYERRANNQTIRSIELAISSGAPENRKLYKQWIRQTPDSALAYWARCEHYTRIGVYTRGAGWAKDVSEEQYAKMNDTYMSALQNCRKALDLDPSLTPAYTSTITMSVMTSQTTLAIYTFNQGIKKAHDIEPILAKYLFWGFTRRWGGTLIEIREAIQNLRPVLESKDKLKPYLSADLFFKARAAELQEKNQEAEALYKRAIEQYGNTKYILYNYRLGQVYKKMGDYEKAIQYLRKAEANNPLYHYIYYHLYRTIDASRYPDKSGLKEINIAIFLATYKPNYLFNRAFYFHRIAKQPEKAAMDYDRVMVYGEYNSTYRYWRGRYHFHHTKNYKEATKDFQYVYEMDRLKPEYNYYHGAALFMQKDCKAKRPLQDFLDLCDKKDCQGAFVSWTKSTMPHLRRFCP